jgi:large subunit ribosomal protein L17
MRHRKSARKLKRTSTHRRALLSALSTALLRHKRITTTVAKAKETRMVVEKIITRAKRAVARTDAPAVIVHARREVGRFIKDRGVVSELFSTIAEKVATRPGGYTRIVKLGQRQGDGAEMAVIELVDFNTGKDSGEKSAPAAKEKKEKKAQAPKKSKKKAAENKEKEPEETSSEKSEKKSKKDSTKSSKPKDSH